MKPSLLERLRDRLRPVNLREGAASRPEAQPPRHRGSLAAGARLAARSVDDNVFFGNNLSAYYRDRGEYDRQTVLAETLRAWRVNPLARSVVRTVTAFVVGKGVTLACAHPATDRFLRAWWDHPLNRLDRQLRRWKDEDTRSGNLFFLFTVDPLSGMSYVRAVPAELITEIQPAENDIEQERFYLRKGLDEPPWPAYDPAQEQREFMLHFASNQPVGTCWGEPDLAPMLPWLGRLSSMLEDRARLQYFRNAFLYVVTGRFASEADRAKRQAEVYANPPQPGSVLVTGEEETWSVLSPELASTDAAQDILALKKYIAAGVNFPLHWLAEPESSTRTTAEAAGTPTFRNLEAIQAGFLSMLERLARAAVEVRRKYDRGVDPQAEITASGPDITERDNSLLALAVNRIYPAAADLYDRRLLDEKELLRLVYRMAAEGFDPRDAPGAGLRRQPGGVGAEQEGREEQDRE